MPGWLEVILFAITIFIMLIGLFGLIVPYFPGMFIIWLAALGYGVVRGFNTLAWILFALITLRMLGGGLIDNVAMGAGARKGGASWITIGLGLLAGVAGTILLPPVGGLIAAPLAILLLEYVRCRNWREAFLALRGTVVGYGVGFILRFAVGVLMILLWVIWDAKGYP